MKIQKVKTTFLIFSGLIILSFSVFVFAEENSSSNKNIFTDSDQDGLTNDEEKTYGTDSFKSDTDGDGYSDGVEVKSGYDPLKPSPGDKIITDQETTVPPVVAGTSAEKNETADGEDKNLTDELSAKLLALVNQSETEQTDIKMEDIDSIIDETTTNQMDFSDLPPIDESTIKVKKQDYSKLSSEDAAAKKKDDALKYFTAVSYILATNSPQKISSSNDFEEFTNSILEEVENFSFESGDLSFFDTLIEKEKSVLTQLQEIEVPEELVGIHKKGIQIATYVNSFRDEVKIDPQDPIKSMTYLSKVTGIISLSDAYFNEVESLLKGYGISTLPLTL